MGICGSKQDSTDGSAVASSKQRAERKGASDNGSLNREQGGGAGKTNKNSKSDYKGNNTRGTSASTETETSKTEKIGSIPSQTVISKGSNDQSSSNSKAKEVKVLLLGAGESGKSTIIQQLKILHQNGFNHEELLEYRPVVYKNILEVGRELIEARKMFQMEWGANDGITQEDIDELYLFDQNKDTLESKGDITEAGEDISQDLRDSLSLTKLTQFPPSIAESVSKIWNLSSSQDLINGPHRSEFYLMDSAQYFMEHLPRISLPEYIPNEQDILRSRQKTSGIFDSVFDVGSNLKLHMYDVGGQRSERKKWIHCFDNVTLIIFCVSLSEYDQTLLEDQSQSRFEESLVLFDNVVNSRWFARTSVVLFLNKIDLFAEKIQKVPLETYFPDYTGGNDVNKAAKYILWRFVQLNRANLIIYPHVTQATDTSNIKLVFAAIKETLLENTLKETGVL